MNPPPAPGGKNHFGDKDQFLPTLHGLDECFGNELRDSYLAYARWLIAAQNLQLAADIIESASAPTWDDFAHLAAVAIIRTFLNCFLERDINETRGLEIKSAKLSSAPYL